MEDRNSVLPEKLMFTFNGNIKIAKEFSYMYYNGEKGAIVFTTKFNASKEMSNGFSKDGLFLVDVQAIQMIDGETKKIVRSMTVDKKYKLEELDTLVVNWELIVDGWGSDTFGVDY